MPLSLSSKAKAEIDRLLSDIVEQQALPSVAFGVTGVDGELHSAQAGFNVFDDPTSRAVTFDDSIFWLCSQGKLITAIAVLQLVDQGKINLDTPVSQILPELANPVVVQADGSGARQAKTEMTLMHLLNNTSGITYDYAPNTPFHLPASYQPPHDREDSVAEFLSRIRGDLPGFPLQFDPGTDFVYGYSSDIVGIIVERVSGQTLEGYYKEHIYGRLGLTSSTFFLTHGFKERRVPLTVREEGKVTAWRDQEELLEQDADKVRVCFGGTGFYSTLKDYLTVLRHLLQIQAGCASNPILTADSVRSLFEPTLPPAAEKTFGPVSDFFFGCGADNQWSTALCINNSDWPMKRRKHSGTWYGWTGTYFLIDPKTGIAMVFGSSIVPTRDPENLKIWNKLEEVLYAGLSTE